jgi:hypothetical protein
LTLNPDDQYESLSPSKLNKELNKILETERMIKEYKEMITKMQRDLYSKKEIVSTTTSHKNKDKASENKSPMNLLHYEQKKVF